MKFASYTINQGGLRWELDQRANLAETRALFDAVNASILTHTYGIPEQRFPEKYGITNTDPESAQIYEIQ
jgi:hypothetical protein